MIVSDLNYLEIAAESNELEGGLDAAFNFTAFQQRLSLMQTGSASGPGGSVATTSGGLLEIGTLGLGAIILGA